MSEQLTRREALKLLSLKEGFTPEQLKTSYKKMAKIYHPDSGGSHDEFLKVGEAFTFLKDNPTPPPKVNPAPATQSSQDTYRTNPNRSNTVNPGFEESGFTQKIKEGVTNFKYLLVGVLTYHTYLIKASLAQLAFMGLLIFYYPSTTQSNSVFYWVTNILDIALMLFSLIIITGLFYIPKIIYLLRLNRISARKLNFIRNTAILIFPLVTAPGYLTFLSIKYAMRLIYQILR